MPWRRRRVDGGRVHTQVTEREPAPAQLAIDGVMELYFGGSMEAAYAMSGQVAGRIDAVVPVREILEETWRDCGARLRDLGAWAAADVWSCLGDPVLAQVLEPGRVVELRVGQ